MTTYPPYSKAEKAQIERAFGSYILKMMLVKTAIWIGLIYFSRKWAKSLEK